MASTAFAVTKFFEVVIPIMGLSSLLGTSPLRLSWYLNSPEPFDVDKGALVRVRAYSSFGGPKSAPSLITGLPAP